MPRMLIALFMVLMISFTARIMMSQKRAEPNIVPATPGKQLPARSFEVPSTERREMERDLRTLLETQVAAWNRGDIEDFMKGYWHSAQTVFAGAGGVQRGWETLLERYKHNYPDRASMGQLKFSQLEITPLASDAAVILGRWQLRREKDAPGGVFTLIARRFPEGWRIIHDHTSAVVVPLAH